MNIEFFTSQMNEEIDQFDYLFKIILTGDSNVGKTKVLSRFMDNKFSSDSQPTIGVEFSTKIVPVKIKGKTIRVKL